jgi:hypothetical protein
MKKHISRIVRITLGITAATLFSSCLENETTVTLNKDGSGTIVEETYLSAEMLEMMAQFGDPNGADPVAEMFTDDKSKAKATKMGEGVEHVKTEMLNVDGKKGARVHFKFADINTLNLNPMGAVSDAASMPGDDAEEEDKSVKFTYADSTLKIIVPPADFKDMAKDDEEDGGNAEMEATMKKMMESMRLNIKLVIADGIAETNATHVEGDTITLFDVQVGKMLEQEDELDKISKLAETDMDAAKAAFSKIDGMKVEMKEDVSVKIK